MTGPSGSDDAAGRVDRAPRSPARQRAAVLGHPVAHSLSPVMHRAAYRALGLTGWRYDAVDVEEAGLGAFLDGLDDCWAGLSVTMPLKRAVREFLDDESDLAREVGAVNTVVLDDLGRHGYNTDVYGIINALAEAGVTAPPRALVLGGGATAASALAALRDLGCPEPLVAVRSRASTGPLEQAADRLGVRPEFVALDDPAALAAAAGLLRDGGAAVVGTLPAGVADPLAELLAAAALGAPAWGGDVPGGAGPPAERPPALLDVVYTPWPTVLAAAWRAAGGPVVGGFSMLVHQAEGQVRLMTGRRPALDVLRDAGQAALDARTRP